MARRRRHSWGAKSAGSNFVSTLGKKQESVQKCDGKQIRCQHSVWRSDSRCYARFHWIMDLSEISFWYWLTHILDDFDEVCVEFWEFSLCSQHTEYLNCSHSYSRILTPLHNGLIENRVQTRWGRVSAGCWYGVELWRGLDNVQWAERQKNIPRSLRQETPAGECEHQNTAPDNPRTVSPLQCLS